MNQSIENYNHIRKAHKRTEKYIRNLLSFPVLIYHSCLLIFIACFAGFQLSRIIKISLRFQFNVIIIFAILLFILLINLRKSLGNKLPIGGLLGTGKLHLSPGTKYKIAITDLVKYDSIEVVPLLIENLLLPDKRMHKIITEIIITYITTEIDQEYKIIILTDEQNSILREYVYKIWKQNIYNYKSTTYNDNNLLAAILKYWSKFGGKEEYIMLKELNNRESYLGNPAFGQEMKTCEEELDKRSSLLRSLPIPNKELKNRHF